MPTNEEMDLGMYPKQEHSPNTDGWVIVSTTDNYIVCHTMCNCGDDDCGYTVSTDRRNIVHQGTGDRYEATS